MNEKELQFALFCIDALAEKLHISGRSSFDLLTEKSDGLDNYIVPFYDVLHTQGSEWIGEELTEFLQNRGVAV
jgi:hypothetical protein